VKWRGVIGRPRPSFRPLLFLFLFGASIRLWALDMTPVAVDDLFGAGTYQVWLAIGIVSPLLALLAWWLIHYRRGAQRYRGLWFRFAADSGMFTAILAYHLAVVAANPLTESRIYSRYIVGAAMVYMLNLLLSDIVSLFVVEKRSRGR